MNLPFVNLLTEHIKLKYYKLFMTKNEPCTLILFWSNKSMFIHLFVKRSSERTRSHSISSQWWCDWHFYWLFAV